MSELLLADNVYQTFKDGKREIEVLRGVNLSVQAGEQIAIVGQSGSGKSTLLQLLGTLDRPTRGEIYLQGQAVSQLSVSALSQLRNQQLGFVYQFHHLLPEFTALENVALPLLMRPELSKSVAMERAHAVLAELGLAERTAHAPAALSGGERQRVAIARAMVTEPSCILADEPTGNLDKQTAQHVFQALRTLNQARKTSLIVVTHDLELAQQLDRQYVLENGRLI